MGLALQGLDFSPRTNHLAIPSIFPAASGKLHEISRCPLVLCLKPMLACQIGVSQIKSDYYEKSSNFMFPRALFWAALSGLLGEGKISPEAKHGQ